MAKPNSKWYKLDSAGTLYSALQKEEYSADTYKIDFRCNSCQHFTYLIHCPIGI